MKWWQIALVVCLLVAVFSPLASSSPDGLERVAEDKGFINSAQEAPFQLIADYVFPGIENEAVATIVAGIIGTLILFGMAYPVGRPEKNRNLVFLRQFEGLLDHFLGFLGSRGVVDGNLGELGKKTGILFCLGAMWTWIITTDDDQSPDTAYIS